MKAASRLKPMSYGMQPCCTVPGIEVNCVYDFYRRCSYASAVLAVVLLSVRPSVCHSHTRAL